MEPLPHQHIGDEWMSCTLCRSHRQSRNVLHRAKQRQIEWPKPKMHSKIPVDDPTAYTSIDDAFASMLQYMSSTSRQCKRYYTCQPGSTVGERDVHHCTRFHTPKYTEVQHKNPLQTAEDVHMVVQPGTYAVTAGEWGSGRQQTHMVHVQQGQTVDLDFVM